MRLTWATRNDDGRYPTICSGTSIDGTLLDNPEWRQAASNELTVVLKEIERDAIDVVKDSDPQQQIASSHAILGQIEEPSNAAGLAAKRISQ